MHAQQPVQRWPLIAALIALLAGPLAGLALDVAPAHAAPSADPSKEIVYIDRDGVIRVLDTQGSPLVQWFSPTGDWNLVDLGDVNADGDLEIVAIGVDGSNTKVAVFDPVIASGVVDPNKKINGIPWDTLYETTAPGIPGIILSDDFDSGIPGDELLYSYRDGARVSHTIVLNADPAGLVNGKPNGRLWKQHIEYIDPEIGREWRFADSGNINGVGSAEAVLVDSKSSLTRFDVFDMDKGFLRIDGKNSSSDNIRKVAVGEIIPVENSTEEIAEIRSTKPGSESLRVYKWKPADAELSTDEGYAFSPQPEYVFLADISGNGDQEVFFLRKNSLEDGSRLIMVNEWGDDQKTLGDIEISLNDIEGGKDDAFKIGGGGDIDGDGRDEVIIASDSRIVVFTEPQRTMAANSRVDYVLPTNNDVIKVGDLDAKGFIEGVMFGTDKSLVEAAVPTGTRGGSETVRVTNLTSNVPINFSVIAGLPAWLTVTPTAGATPTNLTFTFDATNLDVGVYQATVQLTSNEQVINKPYSISVVLTVEPAALSFAPGAASFVYFPCPPTATITDTPVITNFTPMSMDIEIGGTQGLTFQAVILPVPDAGAAGAGDLPGRITGGEIKDGAMLLYDDLGNSLRIDSAAAASISAGDVITWPNNVPWIVSATATTNTVPSTLSLTVKPQVDKAPFDYRQAVMVFVADTRAGSPPDNVKILPITMMCAQDKVMLPNINR